MIPKLDAFNLLYAGAAAVRVFLRTDRGVVLPPTLLSGVVTAIDVGWGLARPIADLVVNDAGIFGTFSFNATPFYVVIPWPAVFQLAARSDAAVADETTLSAVLFWIDDAPTETPPPPASPPTSRRGGHLRAV